MMTSSAQTFALPPMSEPAPRTAAKAKVVDYTIAHHVPGRIRFGIPQLAKDEPFAQRLCEAISAMPIVKRARVNRNAASLIVEYRVDRYGYRWSDSGTPILPALVEHIREAAEANEARDLATTAQPRTAAPAKPAENASHLHPTEVNYVRQLGLPALSLGLSAAMLAGVAVPGALVGAVVLAATVPHAMRAVRGFREEKRLTVEVLDVTASVLLVAQASYLAPAVMISVIESAEVIRAWTARRGKKAALDLLVAPDSKTAVIRNGQQEQLNTAALKPGDLVLVLHGDQIPVDGTVLDGTALIDQGEVMGDATPVTREKGDIVYAGSRVVEGRLSIAATHVGQDTHAAKVLAEINDAPKPDSRVSNYARKTGNWAVPPTLALGGALGLASGSVARATSIVSLDFGLGMRVSAPIAILTAQKDAQSTGILMRSGRAVEMLGQAGSLLIDATAFAVAIRDGNTHATDAEFLARLRDMKVDLHLAGNTDDGLTQTLASKLALDADHVHLDLLSEQKADLISQLQAGGQNVAFFGDSVTDATAMLRADVSIALGSASAVARETADIVLWNNDLRDLLRAIGISRHALRIIKQNQAFVVGSNSAGIAYGMLTVLSPVAGVILNNGVALLAALNSLRSSNWVNRSPSPATANDSPAENVEASSK